MNIDKLFVCMHFYSFFISYLRTCRVPRVPVLLNNLSQVHVQRQDARVWTESFSLK